MGTQASNYEKLKELIESPSFEDRELGFLLFNQIRDAVIFPILERARVYFVQYRVGSPDKPHLCKMERFIGEYGGKVYHTNEPILFIDQQGTARWFLLTEILSINAL